MQGIFNLDHSGILLMSKIDHPNHYNALPVECIDVIEHFDFCIGSALKYLWRAGLKEGEADLDDYKKAIWYIQRKIAKLENERKQKEELMATEDYMREAFGSDSVYTINSGGATDICNTANYTFTNIKRHF